MTILQSWNRIDYSTLTFWILHLRKTLMYPISSHHSYLSSYFIKLPIHLLSKCRTYRSHGRTQCWSHKKVIANHLLSLVRVSSITELRLCFDLSQNYSERQLSFTLLNIQELNHFPSIILSSKLIPILY